ncbi:hypothetical protein C8F04DRAFT_1212394 [Mycena alexandri]|uniref:CxC6 like cysteine cluster associated with KDZ domain-containing protein n=1 Tax=Mycena alexandri TaxID=1745969 RepID=A0AAD6SKS4_9AGAR|nr:hypothetical protein C8F04DRAFT_1212394 [Mycena alexandri]
MAEEYSDYICRDLDKLYMFLGVTDDTKDPASFLFRHPRPILATSRLNCKYCPPGDRNLLPSLRRRRKGKAQRVWMLTATMQWVSADLLVGQCGTCKADYYPDMITRKEYLRVSKHGVWENALHRFHSGWSNFADWVNDTANDINMSLTYRQSQRLFIEHFSHRLLVAHGKTSGFSLLAAKVRDVVGKNGGIIAGAMRHGCMDCTHVKRYREGEVNVGDAVGVVGSEPGVAQMVSKLLLTINVESQHANLQIDPTLIQEEPLPANMPHVLPRQEKPAPGQPRGYTRLSVMDGKSLKHHKCALDDCEGPLVNFKNGQFCEAHLDYRSICGIIPCGRPIVSADAVTCDDPTHIAWHKQYEDRFHRLSFPGVQRVIRRQMAAGDDHSHQLRGPSLQVQLQALGDTPGKKVVHSFKAKSIYCLHIVTQDATDLWLTSTKFIVDAWHYIGHQATDVLCRTRCNPAPTDGSQPDLVLTELDDHGNSHQTRAFNTETAEQLNSWLNGFESQLRQMTDINCDFFIHVLMLLYGEKVEKRVIAKNRQLTQEFWDEVNGIDRMEMDE